MTKRGKQQESQRGKPLHILIPLDSTLEQCEGIAEALRQYAREHPDHTDPRTARRLAGSITPSPQEPGLAEIKDENTGQ